MPRECGRGFMRVLYRGFEIDAHREKCMTPFEDGQWLETTSRGRCMKQSILELILETVSEHVSVGKKTIELDTMAAGLIKLHNCQPAFLGYTPTGNANLNGFPNVMCVSLNGEVIHG